MKKPLVVHPFLFSIFPILSFYAHNIHQLPSSDILLLSAIVLGFTFLMVLLLGLIIRDGKKSGVIVSIILVWFFAYGHVHDVMHGWQIGSFVVGRNRYLIPCFCVLSAYGVYETIRAPRDLHNLTKILNIVALSLVAFSLINIGVYKLKARGNWQDHIELISSKASTVDLGNLDRQRDIYYIIFDSYANSSTLKELWDYDNHEFTDYLTDKGFYIASKSRSNYQGTRKSLKSSLNMIYINDLTGTSEMIRDNNVTRFLKSKGYKIIHFTSGFQVTEHNEHADLKVQCGRDSEFLFRFSETTILRTLPVAYVWAAERRKRLLCTFAKLAEVPEIEGPKFIFAHILAPHTPFLFGADGEPIPQRGHNDEANFVNYTIFLNKKIRMLVDEILSISGVSPIIVLQADHGPRTPGVTSKFTTKWLRKKLRIFNAYYLPAGGDNLLYDSITPVNTFRLIFNFYFGTSYELLDDESYYYDVNSDKRPLRFINVTDQVDYDRSDSIEFKEIAPP